MKKFFALLGSVLGAVVSLVLTWLVLNGNGCAPASVSPSTGTPEAREPGEPRVLEVRVVAMFSATPCFASCTLAFMDVKDDVPLRLIHNQEVDELERRLGEEFQCEVYLLNAVKTAGGYDYAELQVRVIPGRHPEGFGYSPYSVAMSAAARCELPRGVNIRVIADPEPDDTGKMSSK